MYKNICVVIACTLYCTVAHCTLCTCVVINIPGIELHVLLRFKDCHSQCDVCVCVCVCLAWNCVYFNYYKDLHPHQGRIQDFVQGGSRGHKIRLSYQLFMITSPHAVLYSLQSSLGTRLSAFGAG